jgi:hypothetical protein
MAEFKLGRIRFVWKDQWTTGTTYYVDDVVRNGGKTYICSAGHNAAADFYTDLEYSPTRWNQLTDGQEWKGDWTPGTFYKENDIVKYGGIVYICNTPHTSAATTTLGLEDNQSDWDVFAESIEWKGDWTVNTQYKLNDTVKYGGYTYVCNTPHTSAATTTLGLEDNQSDWDEFNAGLEYKGAWRGSSVVYKVNDIVKQGAGLWICTQQHTSTASFTTDSATYWSQFVEGVEFENAWSSGTTYQQGDIVRYGGNQYIAKTNHINETPSTSTDNWDLFQEGISFSSDWSAVTSYRIGNVVRLRGYTYLATADSLNQEPPNTSFWQKLNSGIAWQGEWTDDVEYKLGDAVRFGSNAYICVLGHRSEGDDGSTVGPEGGGADNSRPDQDITGTYWNLLSIGTETSILTTRGDLVYYSGSGPTRLPVGREGQVLRAGVEDPEWVTLGITDQVYYVALHGEDRPWPLNGATLDKPFKTIRYACEQVEKGPRFPNAQRLLEMNRVFIQREVTSWIEYQVANNISPFTNITITDITSNDTLSTAAAHNLIAGRKLRAKTTANGITAETDYYVIDTGLTATAFQLSLTAGGSAIASLTDGTGLTINFVFDYDEYKCERDVGFIVDRLSWDIGHGGNLKIRAAAQSLLGILSEGPFSTEEEDAPYATLSSEREQGIAAYNYMLEVAEAVLNNEAPTTIYQDITDDSTSIAEQFIDTTLVAEDGVMADITSLLTIITDALANPTQVGPLPTIPARYVPFTLISVATGRYRETLPIIVPAYTCVQGDELRSTNTGPANSLVDISDSYYTIDTLGHISSFIGDVVTGTTVTPTSGNFETQSQDWPFADSLEDAAVTQLVDVMKLQSDYRLGTLHTANLTDPVGYNVGYLAGYGNARKLIKENKKFLQEEVISYLENNYSYLEFTGSIAGNILTVVAVETGTVTHNTKIRGQGVATGTVIDQQLSGTTGGAGTYQVSISQTTPVTVMKADTKYSRTDTRRDTGYIIDAIVYDLTYGGNSQSVTAGLAYFDGDNADSTIARAQIPASIKMATLGAIEFLKTRMQSVVTGAGFTPLQTDIPRYSDTAGSAGASTLVGNNLDDIIEIIDTGPSAVGTTVTLTDPTTTNGVSSTTALISAYSTLNAAVPAIQNSTIEYINSNFGDFTYNSTLCRRDSEYLVDAAYYDAAFGSNFWAVQNGLSYLRSQSGVVTSQQLTQELGAIGYIKTRAASSLVSSATAVSRSNAAYNEIIDIITNGVASADALVYTDTGTANFTNARAQLVTNRAFIISEISSWLNTNYNSVWTGLGAEGQATCQRDVGYTIDALAYDVNYGGNIATRNVARSLFSAITGLSVYPDAPQKAASAAMYTQLGVICDQIVQETYAGQDTGGTAASATEGTRMITLCGNIEDVITADSLSGLVAESAPSITWVDNGIETAVGVLASDKTDIVADTLQFISDTYNSFTYDQAKCSRDIATILKAVGYDVMLGNAADINTFTNFKSIIAAQSYLRANASEVYTLGQKTITIAALEYVRTQAISNVGGNATAIARINVLMGLIKNIVYSASNEGDVCSTNLRNRDYAILQLERNRAFITEEVRAYIADTFSDTATNTTDTSNVITISDTSWLRRNVEIKFTGTTFGGITAGTSYYVQSIVSATTFTVSTTRNGSAVTLTTDTGSMGVELVYNQALCLRDVGTYIDALKWDLRYTSNYKSRFVARYYANAVLGSLEEDMYYLRDGCGLRDQTMEGLTGDLLPENAYGTSRVSAGAYASLDPGWGPDDFRTWIISRSPYVQGLTTFGTAAIGQKIDGALHNGGNDSIVSNDFTQVISDGIGAWVANNGRAELVSVFTYYSHIGYLSTEGGRIRGTNGNNSYGDFGSVAEGFDDRETPNTGVVDNIFQFQATIQNATTDGAFLGLEFSNAGIDYTEAAFTLSGGGINATSEADEFRDDAVYQVRLLQLAEDGLNGEFGGQGYVTNSNTAQGGGATSITLAATDSETSTAYIGMKVVITGGAGVGQFAIIATYNSGTKVATVNKESTGTAGWDHFVAGRAIVAPDASSTYTVEPRLTFSAPSYSSAIGTGLPAEGTYSAVSFASAVTTYLAVASTGGAGVGATFNVIKKGTKYIVTVAAGGTGYDRLDVLTIAGTSVGGASTLNNITITITSINSVTGAVVAFDHTGFGPSGNFVALLSGSATAETSIGGEWTSRTLTASRNWIAAAAGQDLTIIPANGLIAGTAYKIISLGDSLFNVVGAENNFVGQTFIATGPTSGSGTVVAINSVVVAIATGSNTTNRSVDGGITWSSGGNLPSSTTWTSVTYGRGTWVAVASGGTANAYSTDGGTTWTAGAALPASATWTSVAYGGGKFVAVASGGTTAAYSTNEGETWTAATLPTSTGWASVAFGNNRFVAVSGVDGTDAAYSLDGITWSASTIIEADYRSVAYGQGTFLAVGAGTTAASSPDGIVWTSRTISTDDSVSVAFGNTNRVGKFVTISNTGANNASVVNLGTQTRARAAVANGKIFAINILEPGSGYTSAPTMTITDPNNTFEAPFTVRTGKGSLANPSFINRGVQYETASAEIFSGDGFADNFQTGSFIAVRRLESRPVPGANVVFGNLPETTFKLVNVITFRGENDGSYTGFLQISPQLTISEAPLHLTDATLRLRYSQVRLTGHDFLDIGTGSFTDTNYPGAPTQDPISANETVDNNGGRVFFTATDQDGNFRVGDLFAIEQSTGIATLNADAFNISGLQELNLGNVTLGGGSATVTEFSTDPFFTADSDNIVPTQRAIKAFISSQIGGGGASLNVNSVTAGSIFISSNVITTVTGTPIKMEATFDFRGGVTGLPLAFNFFLN